MENEKQWFVIHTYSGHEERVKKNLEQRIKFMDSGNEIFQVVIPTEDEIEVRSGRRRRCISTTDKTGNPGSITHYTPAMFIHLHLNQDITRQYLASYRTPASTPNLYFLLSRYNHLKDFIPGIHEPGAAHQVHGLRK